MKYTQLAVSSIILALGSSAFAGSLVPNRIVNIKFINFCDGMRLVINQGTGVVTGAVTGCVIGTPIGTVGGNSSKGIGVTVMSRTFQYVIDDISQTWSLYTSNGALLQSGTWAVGIPLAAPNADAGSTATGN